MDHSQACWPTGTERVLLNRSDIYIYIYIYIYIRSNKSNINQLYMYISLRWIRDHLIYECMSACGRDFRLGTEAPIWSMDLRRSFPFLFRHIGRDMKNISQVDLWSTSLRERHDLYRIDAWLIERETQPTHNTDIAHKSLWFRSFYAEKPWLIFSNLRSSEVHLRFVLTAFAESCESIVIWQHLDSWLLAQCWSTAAFARR